MTDITILRLNGSVEEVTCSGHTGFGESGEDIVCAAISSIVQTALLGLLSVTKINVKFETDEVKGYLHFKLPEQLSHDKRRDADIVLDTMLCGLSDIHLEYSDYMNLEVK